MSLTTTKPLPPSSRLVLTPDQVAVIKEGARSISPSWDATHVSDPNCPADSASIGATSGGCTLFDVFDTYGISPIEGGRFELLNVRDGFIVLGTFPTLAGAVEAMKAHAAAVRY